MGQCGQEGNTGSNSHPFHVFRDGSEKGKDGPDRLDIDRDRVRAAVQSGVVRQEEFAGAFRKSAVTRIAVMRARPEDGVPGGAGHGSGAPSGPAGSES